MMHVLLMTGATTWHIGNLECVGQSIYTISCPKYPEGYGPDILYFMGAGCQALLCNSRLDHGILMCALIKASRTKGREK
jgi:hypothetical protein